MNTREFTDRAGWRVWLSANHAQESEIWLVFYRKDTGIPTISYKDALDEALCYGWIDSLIKKLDETKYARKFTPRKDNSQWSLVNKKRVEQLIQDGLMTEHGLKKVEAAKQSGSWDHPGQKPPMDFAMPVEFTEALKNNPQAEETFNNLAPTHRKQYIVWISVAKRQATKEKRIAESIQLLSTGKKLGLK